MPSITTKTATAFTGHKWALALTRIPVVSKEGVEAYNYPIVSMAFPVTTGGAILHDDSAESNIFTSYPPTDTYEDPRYLSKPYSGGEGGASATLVFHSTNFSGYPSSVISLMDGRGNRKTYTATSGVPSGKDREFQVSGDAASAVAQNFIAVVNSASGHGGTIIASRSGATVTLTQNSESMQSNTWGLSGNSPISMAMGHPVTDEGWKGRKSVCRLNADGSYSCQLKYYQKPSHNRGPRYYNWKTDGDRYYDEMWQCEPCPSYERQNGTNDPSGTFSSMLSGAPPTQFAGGVDAAPTTSVSGFSVIRLTDGYNTVEQAVSALKIKVVDTPVSAIPSASAGVLGAFNGAAHFGMNKSVDLSGLRSDWSAVSGTALGLQASTINFSVPLAYALNTAFSACSQASAVALLGRSEIALTRAQAGELGETFDQTYDPNAATAGHLLCCCKYQSTNKFQMWILMSKQNNSGKRLVRIRGGMSRSGYKQRFCLTNATSRNCGGDECHAKSTTNYYMGATKGNPQGPCSPDFPDDDGKDMNNNKVAHNGEILLTGSDKQDFDGWNDSPAKGEVGSTLAICIRYHLTKLVHAELPVTNLTDCTSDCSDQDDPFVKATTFDSDFVLDEKGAQNPNGHGNGDVDGGHPDDLLADIFAGLGDSVSGGLPNMHADLSGQGVGTWAGEDAVDGRGNPIPGTDYVYDSRNGNDGWDETKTWDDLFYPKGATTGDNAGWHRKGVPCLTAGTAASHSKATSPPNSDLNPIDPPSEMFGRNGSSNGYKEINTWESGGPNNSFDAGTDGETKGRANNSVNQVGSELAEYMLSETDGFSDFDLGINGTAGSKRGSNACKAPVRCELDLTKKYM